MVLESPFYTLSEGREARRLLNMVNTVNDEGKGAAFSKWITLSLKKSCHKAIRYKWTKKRKSTYMRKSLQKIQLLWQTITNPFDKLYKQNTTRPNKSKDFFILVLCATSFFKNEKLSSRKSNPHPGLVMYYNKLVEEDIPPQTAGKLSNLQRGNQPIRKQTANFPLIC